MLQLLRPLWLLLPLTSLAWGQQPIAPFPGLREADSTTHALQGCRIYVTPDRVIDDATLVVRKGLIVAVGSDLTPPANAIVTRMTGKTIYPGFIDAYGEVTIGASQDGTPAGGYFNPRVAPQVRASAVFASDDQVNETLRSQGIALRLLAPRGAIISGRSVLVTTGDSNTSQVMLDNVALHVQLEPLARSYHESFPNSIMGTVALVRQAFSDARWHCSIEKSLRSTSLALDTLAPYACGEGWIVFDAPDELAFLRADAVAREFDLKAIVLGSGSEFRRLAAIRDTGRRVIVPLAFPGRPAVQTIETALDVSLEDLLQWDLAPENPGRLAAAGVPIALTTHGLDDAGKFLAALRQAVRRGLKPGDALRALTTSPAEMFGIADRAGTLGPGRSAHFVVTDGDLFVDTTKVLETWIGGRRYEVKHKKEESQKETEIVEPNEEAPAKAHFDVNYPLGEYGSPATPAARGAVLFRNACVWTGEQDGCLPQTDVLVRAGKIAEIGRHLSAEDAFLVDCTGRHLTAGLIDCHSHIAITGGITDSGKTTTGDVRIGDVVNSDDIEIYRQLAGGVTCANLLPGSDNVIGGQSQVVKFRWGTLPDEMKFYGAPPGIKLALGENVKQSNWGDEFNTRYPQTRMGVEQLLLDRFQAAEHYRLRRKRRGDAVRRDLELDALAEVIAGTRRLHCHAYRQDEILAYIRLCDGLGLTAGTLHHASDAYKVADLLAVRQVAVSTFSDWWAYKFEAFEAIPHNAAMLGKAGVSVSINSDDAEMGRRLNMEAAKAIKYGGLSETEALRLITIYPARQLGLDGRVGTISPGTDADLVVWSDRPLSASTRCEQSWIDGRCYFDREADASQRQAAQAQRAALIQRVLSQPDP